MQSTTRRTFLGVAGAGAAMAAATFGTAEKATAQLVYKKADWDVAAFARLAHDPARVKQVYDIAAVNDGRFLNNVKNSLNGLHFGWGIPENDIKIVAALHGPSNMLCYDDALWAKYDIGAWLKVNDPATGQPAARNPFYASKAGPEMKYSSADADSRESMYQDASIQALQHRGVKFLSCHTALEEQARALVKHNNLNEEPETVVRDMMSHALPGVLIVASMVAAIALLQTDGHYSYITV